MTQKQNSILVSIIIPTKNRYKTLVPVLEALLRSLEGNEFEVVVQDNSDECFPESSRELLNHPRVSYERLTGQMSVVENTEAGITRSVGKYLVFIGDDDLVSPYIVRFAKLLASLKMECLIFQPGKYWWPDTKFVNRTGYFSPTKLWLPRSRDFAVRVLNSECERLRVIKAGGVTYGDLPRLYHGLVSRSALERVKERAGRFVPGSSPDIACAFALSYVIDRYLFINFPLTVFGASKESGGGWTVSRRHFGRIEDQKHLPSDILKKWDPRVPLFWTELTIYAQSIYEVVKAFGKNHAIFYPALYASLLVNEGFIFRGKGTLISFYRALNTGERILTAKLFLRKIIAFIIKRALGDWKFRQYELLTCVDVDSVAKVLMAEKDRIPCDFSHEK